MCGISGIWNYGSKASVDRASLRGMSDTLSHRGPDDSGEHFDDVCGLGLAFRRLSIIDLSPAGHQPMCNEDGAIWVVFNGEIYNFRDLRRSLESAGHKFRSRSDAEVIVHNYEDRGAECIADLNGMFALAIWDARISRLTLSRDRVGKKPLYYYDDGRRFLFASELKAILADPSVPREIDYEALGEYLALGYVPSPRTIFKGIRKLPAGHFLVLERGVSNVRRYWDWLPAFRNNGSYTEGDWITQIRALLKTVVRDRLSSDVPLGAFLSGGVDSSAVVATMAELSDHPVKTFSIGFRDERFNELRWAREVAERFGTEHHEWIVEPDAVRELMPRLALHFDEPFGDSSAIPTYYVAEMAKRHVTVVLSGDGGDEAFGGYDRYSEALRERYVDMIPLALRRSILALPSALIPVGVKGHALTRRYQLTAEERYISRMRQVPSEMVPELLTCDALQQAGVGSTAILEQFMRRSEGLDDLSRLQYVDAMTYLPEDILVKVDRATMAHSLEARCPLLDHRFMELAAGIPSDYRLRDGSGKFIFKRALRGLIPDTVLDRPKMGFGVPLRAWFRDDLYEYAAEVLFDPSVGRRGVWRHDALRLLLRNHTRGNRRLQTVIWMILMFETWAQLYLGR